MVQLSRQEVQTIVDGAKNRIVERMLVRQDIQQITDISRDRVLTYMHDLIQIHQQQLFRRANMQNTQLQRQMVTMEARMINMEQDVKAMRQLIERLANQEPQQHIYIPTQPETNTEKSYAKYVYQS